MQTKFTLLQTAILSAQQYFRPILRVCWPNVLTPVLCLHCPTYSREYLRGEFTCPSGASRLRCIELVNTNFTQTLPRIHARPQLHPPCQYQVGPRASEARTLLDSNTGHGRLTAQTSNFIQIRGQPGPPLLGTYTSTIRIAEPDSGEGAPSSSFYCT